MYKGSTDKEEKLHLATPHYIECSKGLTRIYLLSAQFRLLITYARDRTHPDQLHKNLYLGFN